MISAKSIELNLTNFKSQIESEKIDLLVKNIKDVKCEEISSIFLASNELDDNDLLKCIHSVMPLKIERKCYSPPKEFKTHIVNLDVSFNKLSISAILLVLESFPSLQRLDARGNKMKGELVITLTASCLHTLLLTRNELTRFLISTINPLMHLDLHYNKLEKIKICAPSVAHLNVSNNRIAGLTSNHMDLDLIKPEKTLTVDVSNNMIASSLSSISQLFGGSLLSLDLSHNRELSFEISAFDFMYNLKQLFLQENNIIQLPDMSDLISLSVLDVSYTNLTSIPESICKLAHLTHFYAYTTKTLVKNGRKLTVKDYSKYTSPPSSIVEEGLQSIVKFLMRKQ